MKTSDKKFEIKIIEIYMQTLPSHYHDSFCRSAQAKSRDSKHVARNGRQFLESITEFCGIISGIGI